MQNSEGGAKRTLPPFLFRQWLSLLLLGALLLSPAAQAASGEQVIPLGQAVGIKLFSDGVLVVGLSDLSTGEGETAPARCCGMQEGDIITHINGEKVDSIEAVQAVLQKLSGEQMEVTLLRQGKPMRLQTQAVRCRSDGSYRLGAWIRDSMAGIGTMTFYEPESGLFATLGHGINDVDTAQLMPLLSGAILPARVAAVNPGRAGTPGELRGEFELDRELGTLFANTKGGVFGRLTDTSCLPETEPVEVAEPEEVREGRATILSNIHGDEVASYEVEIVRLSPWAQDGRDLMLHVTDERLLAATGGIVQGMSGSPILQNGKLVGAVTHVLVNDPTRGYGIFAVNMLSRAQQAS